MLLQQLYNATQKLVLSLQPQTPQSTTHDGEFEPGVKKSEAVNFKLVLCSIGLN